MRQGRFVKVSGKLDRRLEDSLTSLEETYKPGIIIQCISIECFDPTTYKSPISALQGLLSVYLTKTLYLIQVDW